MRKPTTWVLYKWERFMYGLLSGNTVAASELKVQSKDAWQSSKKTADTKPEQYRATWLAESTDKAMLEKMRDLTKE